MAQKGSKKFTWIFLERLPLLKNKLFLSLSYESMNHEIEQLYIKEELNLKNITLFDYGF